MGKFAVKMAKTGIKLDPKASNSEVLVTSEVYTSRNACLNGVENVRKTPLRRKLWM